MDLRKKGDGTVMQKYNKYNKRKWDKRFKSNHLNISVTIAM